MRTGPLVLAAALLLALTGCVPGVQHSGGAESPSPSLPTPSATPVFASDDEALAAAEKAYAAYLKVSDAILQDGGKNPTRLLEVATQNVYDIEAVGYASAIKKMWHSVGGSTFSNMTLESYTPADSARIVTGYVCTDISEVDVLDSGGSSVISSERPNRTAFEVSFAEKARSADLILSQKDVWSGGGIC